MDGHRGRYPVYASRLTDCYYSPCVEWYSITIIVITAWCKDNSISLMNLLLFELMSMFQINFTYNAVVYCCVFCPPTVELVRESKYEIVTGIATITIAMCKLSLLKDGGAS